MMVEISSLANLRCLKLQIIIENQKSNWSIFFKNKIILTQKTVHFLLLINDTIRIDEGWGIFNSAWRRGGYN